MSFNGININRLTGGLNRKNPTEDGVCVLVIGGAVAATDLALKTAVEFLSIENAEAVGITPSFDDTNSILAHHHIDEFFRVSPNGNLFVVLDDDTLTTAELTAIVKANATIKNIGFVRNAEKVTVPPLDMAVLVAGYQTMVSELRAENRNISNVLVEGGEFTLATLISAYVDARTYDSGNVSVVISQDPIIRALKSEYETYASVGTALGGISVRGVHENLGSVDIEKKPSAYKGNANYQLTDVARKRWLSAVLQDGKAISDLSPADIKALNDKGYIFVGNYNGYDGFYFNDSHTCIEKASDYSRIENNRVWDKGADLARKALLPRVKSNLLKDPVTGFIRENEATELEVIATNAINQMLSAGEISGHAVYVNPEQDISNDTPLNVKGQLVFNNIIHEMSFDLGLTNKLQ
jgi:hypothetical protein